MDGRQQPVPQPDRPNDPNDEEIIDLTQVVEESPDDDIIDLSEMVEAASGTVAGPRAVGTDAADGSMDVPFIELTDRVAPSPAEIVGSRMAAPMAATPMPDMATGPLTLTDEQVEAALEKIVERIYREKIEGLMIRTIERTVNDEIAKIKKALMADDDDRFA